MQYDIVLINTHFTEKTSGRRVSLPLGLLYLGAIIKQAGLKVKIIDYNQEPPSSIDEIKKDILSHSAPIYGISSLLCAWGSTQEVIAAIRSVRSDADIILGGPISHCISDIIQRTTGVDLVVEGEAESVIIGIIKEKFSSQSILKTEILEDLDNIPFPDWSLVNMTSYFPQAMHAIRSEVMRTFPFMSSRGCPYRCHFCCKSLGHKQRLRKVDSLVEEIKVAHAQYHFNDIWFVDEEFALTESRVEEIADKLESLNLSFVCSMRANLVTPTMLRDFKRAGCRRILYGIESGSQKMLDAMGKNLTVEQAERAIIETRKAGIEAYTNFIIGYPGETEQTVRETVSFMKRLRLYSGFGLAVPLPGTEMFNWAVKNNIIKNTVDYLDCLDRRSWISGLVVNLTELSDIRLLELREWAKRELFDNRIVLKE